MKVRTRETVECGSRFSHLKMAVHGFISVFAEVDDVRSCPRDRDVELCKSN